MRILTYVLFAALCTACQSRANEIDRDPWVITKQVYHLDRFEVLHPNPHDFRFENYTFVGISVLAEALSCLFPHGTPKAFVDSVLVEQAGATYENEFIPETAVSSERIAHSYRYNYQIHFNDSLHSVDLKVFSEFDSQQLLKVIGVAGTGVEGCGGGYSDG